MIILVPPRRKIVTAFEFLHSSITNIRSLVVPTEFPNSSCASELICCQFLKTGNNSSTGCNCNQLYFRTTYPPDGRKFTLQKQMICLIIKAPLANSEIGTGFFHLTNHFIEFFGFILAQFPIIFRVCYIQLVLGFWLWWFKWAGQNG